MTEFLVDGQKKKSDYQSEKASNPDNIRIFKRFLHDSTEFFWSEDHRQSHRQNKERHPEEKELWKGKHENMW